MATLSQTELNQLHAYWQAANYLAAGQIYLQQNPLLREPLRSEHIKPRLLGHWGTSPGLSLIYTHLNRLICKTNANVMYICGPGHGAPAILAHTYLEGTYSEFFPSVGKNEEGILKLFRQFSTPGGIPSHVSAHTPGSIHEGGELGYSLVHAFGAAFDNPELLVACVIGDGEAETGPLAGSWKSLAFLNPIRDGSVLPILHLNGYKISGPTVMSRKSNAQLQKLFEGHGYRTFFVEGDNPMTIHEELAQTLDQIYDEIQAIRSDASKGNNRKEYHWPMLVLRTPKGWTGPKEWNGKPIEGTFRSHQVPLTDVKKDAEQLNLLEQWLLSYEPDNLFDENGRLRPDLAALSPKGIKRIGATPYSNGGHLFKELQLPDMHSYGVVVAKPAMSEAQATRNLGTYLRDVFRLNEATQNFRLFCPDETTSNRLDAVFEATSRCFTEEVYASDVSLSPEGRVMEVLSEHLCQGWLEGYLLTGRHGVFSCYEAFITIIDSMFSQYAKWLKMCQELPWRKPIASLTYLLTSHSWRQDHNGYSHQEPGFIDTVVNKKSTVIRIYLPPDSNSLLSVMDHCLRSRNYVNVIIAGKQPELQYMDLQTAIEHCDRGASVWKWASNDTENETDVVLACAGDVPTLETVAAAWLLSQYLPSLRVRVVNVIDLMSLAPTDYHPHGLDSEIFDSLFTRTSPVIFAFHGYVRIIHDLVHGRPEPERFHVRGYMEEGTTTTPFDMVVANQMSRYHLAIEAVRRTNTSRADEFIAYCEAKLQEHQEYIRTYFDDMPEIKEWKWTEPKVVAVL